LNVCLLATSLITPACNVTALTMKQVSDICHPSYGEYRDHLIIQPYVGGVLDLLAPLDEQTDYARKCIVRSQKRHFGLPRVC
jgi:hypothetical protein